MFILKFLVPNSILDELDQVLEQAECLDYSAFENPSLGFSTDVDEAEFPIANFFNVEVLFQSEDSISGVISTLQAALGENIRDVKVDELADADWVQLYLNDQHPVVCGDFYIFEDRHNVVYEMENAGTTKNLIPIKINAALAFGSGYHRTTQMCLRNLLELSRRCQPNEILDMGCGSGILGICALKLWPKASLTGIDIDRDAAKIAKRNYKANGINGQAKTASAVPKQSFDLIMCNILKRPLIDLHKDFYGAINAGGHIIISGFIKSQEDDIVEAYTSAGFKVLNSLYQDDWASLLLVKP
ncbi:MAG: 50S ribosomal protein L11 methyltransferase [Holosporales bacterium]|jgi:ribosomal protein L11 methyltransferase|nr:50S ribosomal protein L11 methyltransferase [Holosporales bacterium]